MSGKSLLSVPQRPPPPLPGIIPPSGGDALIYDESLTAPGGMDRIRSFIGVCPQFDVLWEQLTGQEHLEIYGQVKGITAAESKREVTGSASAEGDGPC